MRRRIAVAFSAIGRFGQHVALGVDDHRAHRHLAPLCGLPRELQRALHRRRPCRSAHNRENSRNRDLGGVMRFSFSPEQDEFRTTLRRALQARSPTKEVRRLMATEEGFDREAWKRLNQELGLTAIHVPEAYGGQGFGFSELSIVLEEMGRGLLCAPYFSTAALATTAILNAGTEEQKRALLPGIAAGDVTATLAFSEEGGLNDGASVEMTATPSGPTWRLDGAKSFVLDGHTADLLIVV